MIPPIQQHSVILTTNEHIFRMSRQTIEQLGVTPLTHRLSTMESMTGTPSFRHHALAPNPLLVVHVPALTCTVGVSTAEVSRYSSLVAVREGLIA